MEIDIEKTIKPETDLEKHIIRHPDFIKGMDYGKPRSGHPEGKVIFHVADVLSNIDKYSTSQNRSDLRLVAIIHDSFKYAVDLTKPKTGENHHAMLARHFAEKFNLPNNLLDIIELHDEAFNCYCKGQRSGKWESAKERAFNLIKRLGDNLELSLIFNKCDNETGDKTPDNVIWFREICDEFKSLKQ